LKAISKQGEAPIFAFDETDELSHFDRFSKSTRNSTGSRTKAWATHAPRANQSTTLNEPDVPDPGMLIAAEHSRQWAGLFNLRYACC